MKIRRIKLLVMLFFVGLALVGFTDNSAIAPPAGAYSTGPPPGVTGAPGEVTCNVCHFSNAGPGQFAILAPANYTPGQTYQVQVRHTTSDTTRRRWGFELTALSSSTASAAGTFSNVSNQTQTLSDSDRFYIEHTLFGTFNGQTGGAQWTFEWTAPPNNVGEITFYAAGNQANGDGTFDGDRILTATATVQPATAQAPRTRFDFDGDGKADISIFRPNTAAEWWYIRSVDGQVPAAQFGAGTDKVVAADYTGDGKTDIAFFRPSTGQWFILRSEDGSFYAFPFGTGTDIPMPADYDGDGKTDPTVFRPSSATWFILRSSDSQVAFVQFGASADQPVAADYDGDGTADIAIYRPSGTNGAEWWVQRSSNGIVFALQFGISTDKAVPGDYTGDHKADIAFFRPSSGEWFVLRSEDFSFFAFPWGTMGDIAVPSDYDGDGIYDAAVFRPSTTTWFISRSTQGPQFVGFGLATDQPVANSVVR
jgi:hypothetical protein